jgi:hypothetical protein
LTTTRAFSGPNPRNLPLPKSLQSSSTPLHHRGRHPTRNRKRARNRRLTLSLQPKTSLPKILHLSQRPPIRAIVTSLSLPRRRLRPATRSQPLKSPLNRPLRPPLPLHPRKLRLTKNQPPRNRRSPPRRTSRRLQTSQQNRLTQPRRQTPPTAPPDPKVEAQKQYDQALGEYEAAKAAFPWCPEGLGRSGKGRSEAGQGTVDPVFGLVLRDHGRKLRKVPK